MADFSEAYQEIEVLRVIKAYENGISIDIHCAPEGGWTRLPNEPFTKGCKLRVNPNDVLTTGSPPITSFINYLEPFLVPAELDNILESSDVVGNIRFSRPTLYVFPGGQGDAALFGINGFNMLLDGGFSRKACFWDFVRHLDRLDAVLLTRLNNSNVNGISAVLRRKKQNALYPQVGHFFCNIQERKAILSPDGDKDKDPLLINLLEEGQEIVSNLKHLSLTPQVCYRDSEPINLYHKVGHGTLDMYVLSPAKDSKEVREFLQRWNSHDQKLFASQKFKEFVFPLQNLVSICALLVWQPANPEDTITRILFPGSSPQNKIFEGLDKIKNLEFIKHPMCTEKSLTPTAVIKSKQSVLEKLIQSDKKPSSIDNKIDKKEKNLKPDIIDNEIKNGHVNGITSEKIITVKKSDSTESEKSEKTLKLKKMIENGDKAPEKPKFKPKSEPRSKPRSESQQRKVKSSEKKPSPTTPKKTIEKEKVNGEAKPKQKFSPSATPAKSTKDANNRKVLESKIKAAPPPPAKKEPLKPPIKETKVERKPISRRPKDVSKTAASPSKKVNGVQKPDSLSRRGKLDKEGTTDSSTVSTPSAEQETIFRKDISKLTTDEIQNLKAEELADLKEEQEAVKEIEAVFRKSEHIDEKTTDFRKIKDLSLDDKLESEEYLIVEKTETEQTTNESLKEDETQKMARDSEESEKQRKLSGDLPSSEVEIAEKRLDIPQEVEQIIASAAEIIKAKEEIIEVSKELSATTPEEKMDVSTDKKDNEMETKENAAESQPDEKGSANVESGATTTAPTLPEDERMPLDEIKEDNGDQVIEEKHVKEDTKEKDIPVIQLPPKNFEPIPKLPPVVGIRLDKQSHIRDIVKTPDEVADLPVHEEVDYEPEVDESKKEGKDNDKIDLKPDFDVDKNRPKEKAVDITKTETDIQKKESADEPLIIKKTDDVNVEAITEQEQAVISEDLNKKELSKSPDEEKDIDDKETEFKKEKIDEVKAVPDTISEKEKIIVNFVDQKESRHDTQSKEQHEPQIHLKEEVIEKSEIEVDEKKTKEEAEKIVDKTEQIILDEQKQNKEVEQIDRQKKEDENLHLALDDIIHKKEETKTAKDSEKNEEPDIINEEKKINILKDNTEDEEPDKPEEKTFESKKEEKTIVKDLETDKLEKTMQNQRKETEIIKDSKADEEFDKTIELEKVDETETAESNKNEATESEIVPHDQTQDENLDTIKKTQAKENKIDETLERIEETNVKTEKEDQNKENLEKTEKIKSQFIPVDEKKIELENIKKVEKKPAEVKFTEIEDTHFQSNQDKNKTIEQEAKLNDTKIEHDDKKIEVLEEHEDLEIKTDKEETTKTQIVENGKEIAELQKVEDLKKIIEKEILETSETNFKIKKDDKEVEKLEEIITEKVADLETAEDGDDVVEEITKIVTHKTEELQHAEPVIITADSLPDTPTVDEKLLEDRLDLGRKSPKEREEDVAKIVASVAEVLKSDAPLEEFEGKISFSIPYKSYTTELRETHITTVDSPVTDTAKTVGEPIEKYSPRSSLEEETRIAPIDEEPEIEESKIIKMMRDSNDLMQATSKIIQDIKQVQPHDINEDLATEDQEEGDGDGGTVHRMLVTASSEDGGEETEICPAGTITFAKSSESSGRSSPELQSQKISQKSSTADTVSDPTVISAVIPKSTETEQHQSPVVDKEHADTDKSTSDIQIPVERTIKDELSTEDVQIEESISPAVGKTEANEICLKETDSSQKLESEIKKEDKPAAATTKPEKSSDTSQIEELSSFDIKETTEAFLKTEVQTITGFLEDFCETIKETVTKAEETIKKNIVSTVENLKEMKDSEQVNEEVDRKKNIESIIDDIENIQETAFEESKKNQNDYLEDQTNYKEATKQAEPTLESKTDKTDDKIVKEKKGFFSGIMEDIGQTIVKDIKDCFSETKKDVEEVIDETKMKLEGIKDEVNLNKDKVTKTVDGFVEEVKKDIADIKIEVEDKITETKQAVAAEKNKLAESAVGMTKSFTEAAKDGVEDIKIKTDKEISETKTALIEEKEKLLDTAVELVDTIKTETDKTFSDTKTVIVDEKNKFVETTTDLAKSCAEEVAKTLEEIEIATDAKLEKTEREIVEQKDELVPLIEKSVKTVENDLNDSKIISDEKVDDKIIEEKSKLMEAATGFSKDLVDDITAAAEDASTKITQVKDSTIAEITYTKESLQDEATTVVNIISDLKDEIVKEIPSLVNDSKDAVLEETEILDNENSLLQKKASDTAKSIPIKLEKPLEETNIKIEQLEQTIDKFSDKLEDQVAETTSKIKDDIEDLHKSIKESEDFTKTNDDTSLDKESMTPEPPKTVEAEMEKIESRTLPKDEEIDEKADKALAQKVEIPEPSAVADSKIAEDKLTELEKLEDTISTSINDAKPEVDSTQKEISVASEDIKPKIDVEQSEETQKLNVIEEKKITDDQVMLSKDIKTASTDDLEADTTTARNALEEHSEDKNQLSQEILTKTEKLSTETEPKEFSHKQPESLEPQSELKVEKQFLEEIKAEVDYDPKQCIEESREIVGSVQKKLEETPANAATEKTVETIKEYSESKDTEKTGEEAESFVANVKDAEQAFESYNGVESKESSPKEKIADKQEAESMFQQEISDIREFVKDSVEAIADIIGKDSHKDTALEKSAHDLEDKYNTVSEMAKSVVFEKIDRMSETEVRENEEKLEKSAKAIEDELSVVADLSQAISFEKCRNLTEEERNEEVLEKAAKTIEDDFQTVSEMARSISFEKCAKPDTTEKLHKTEDTNKDEKIEEQIATKIKEDFNIMADMTQSIIFEKCEKPDEQKEQVKHVPEDLTCEVKSLDQKAIEKIDSQPEKIKIETSLGKLEIAAESSRESSPAYSIGIKGTSRSSTPDIKDMDQIKVDGHDSLLSGKSSPALSGRSTPNGKEESKDSLLSDHEKEDSKDSLLSDKASPILAEESKNVSSGKVSPLLKEKESSDDEIISEDPLTETVITSKSLPEQAIKLSENELKKTEILEDKKIIKSEEDTKSDILDSSKKTEEKTDSREIDSLDSGFDTDVESKLKRIETESLKEENIAGPSSILEASVEDLHLSGKSTPDIADIENMKIAKQEILEKHILGSSTPPTVPVSPIVKDTISTMQDDTKSTPIKVSSVSTLKESDIRSCTPGSDDYEIVASTYSDISSGQMSRAPQERIESDDDDEVPGSPLSVTSQVPHSRSSSRYDFEDDRIGTKMDPMNTSFYGALPDEPETLDFEKAMVEHRETRGEDLLTSTEPSSSYLYELTKAKYSSGQLEESPLDQNDKKSASNVMTESFIGELPTTTKKDAFDSWGKPLGLPSPAPPTDNKGTPKKERKLPAVVTAKNKLNDDKKRSESPSKYKNKKINPVYVDLTYVPHHGNGYYSYVDFFKRIRARYYVFSGIEPSREVYSALLEAKQTWEDKELGKFSMKISKKLDIFILLK